MASILERELQNKAHTEDIPALVAGAKNDPATFGRLYDIYVQPIYRYVYSRVGSAHEAEDLTSQTFLSAFEHLPRYRESGQFAAWLFRIARSKLLDHFRKNRKEVDLEAAEELGAGADAVHQVIQDEELASLRSLIRKLKPDEQDLIHLRYVAGLSFAEMAGVLGKNEQAVKQSVYRLLARLKSRME